MILRNCRLIPELSGGVSAEKGTVLVRDGKIAGVYTDGADLPESAGDGAPAGSVESAELLEKAEKEGEQVIDCHGKTLLPGLIDAHTHIAGLRDFSVTDLKKPMSFFVKTAEYAKRYLSYGFTTIRDCGTALRVNNFVRDAAEGGTILAPRIISCGLILSPTEIEEQDEWYDIYSWADGADAFTHAARKELAEHADFLKVMASDSALHKQGIPVQPIMTRREMDALVEIADLKDSYVAAHAHGDGAIRLCAEAGVRTIEHASFISEETAAVVKDRGDCALIPTVSAMYQNPDTTPESYMFLVEKLNDMLAKSSVCLGHAYQEGLTMGFGTDSGPGMDQYENGIEFRFRSERCHMRSIDILLQATRNNAAILGLSDVTGEIKPGLAADLILVSGNSDEDISVMYHRPESVFLGGREVEV